MGVGHGAFRGAFRGVRPLDLELQAIGGAKLLRDACCGCQEPSLGSLEEQSLAFKNVINMIHIQQLLLQSE